MYLKLEMEIQVSNIASILASGHLGGVSMALYYQNTMVSSISESSGQKNKFIRLFWGKSCGSTILFRDLLTFSYSCNAFSFKWLSFYSWSSHNKIHGGAPECGLSLFFNQGQHWFARSSLKVLSYISNYGPQCQGEIVTKTTKTSSLLFQFSVTFVHL